MSELDSLPADQRAVLQLLLKQGQSYDQLADLLGIDAGGVRARAHAALAGLGSEEGARLDPERRAEVCDYLLGQQSARQREATRDLLGESAAARAWAGDLTGALRPLAGDALPDIPGPAAAAAPPPPVRDEPEPFEPEPFERERPTRERRPRDRGPREEEPAAFDVPARRRPRRGLPRLEGGFGASQSSRLGGALLLGGVGIVIAVIIVMLMSGGDDTSKKGSTVTPTAPTQTSTNAQKPIAQINLFSAAGNSKQVGLAQVFEQKGKRALIVAGQGLAPGAYALWLFNSKTDAKLLGFVPQRVGKDGRFATQGELSADAGKYKKLVVTSEVVTRTTRTPPKLPGQVVLQGDLKLG
jgi:hypothetical protein